MYFDWTSSGLDLSPRLGFVRTGSSVAPLKLVSSVYEDNIVGSVSLQKLEDESTIRFALKM